MKKDESAKIEEDETIKDRTPILDQLIEKMKFFNVDKKKMIDRYQKNSHIIKEALEQMMEYLGINTYSELPFVLRLNLLTGAVFDPKPTRNPWASDSSQSNSTQE